MPTNNFLPFCPTDTGTNLETQVDYAADSQRTTGNQPGIAKSKLVNKALRQANWITSQLAQYMVNVTGDDVLDDQNSGNILATMADAFGTGFHYVVATTTYSAAIKDFVNCTGASFAVTLPTAIGVAGLSIGVKHNGTSISQSYTINTTSAQTMKGSAGSVASGDFVLQTLGEVVIFTSDGANWMITDRVAQTPWLTFVPSTFSGFGSTGADVISSFYRRVGDSIEVNITFTVGGAAASVAQLGLPTGLTIATGKGITADPAGGGTMTPVGTFWSSSPYGSVPVVIAIPGNSFVNFCFMDAGHGAFTPFLGNAVTSTSTVLTVRYIVPITGWQP